MKISEKEFALSHADDHDMQKFLMWDVSSQRIADRNMPFIELKNESDDTPITEFRISIGDTRFNFSNDFYGSFTVLGETSPFTDITSMPADGDNELVVMFGSGGLQPGQLVRFRIDLDKDTGFKSIFKHPDFRTVLFDMNGRNVYDGNVVEFSNEDNAEVTVTFGTGEAIATASSRLPDATVTGPQADFYNNVFRTYGIMEGIDTFPLTGTVIPEPNAMALTMLGLVGLGLITQRRGLERRQYASRGASYRSRFVPRPSRNTACRHRARQPAGR
jgi:hypothetical protein